MFINTHVFINSPVVYKLWAGGKGGGGGGRGLGTQAQDFPTPPLPPSPQVRDLRISGILCVTVAVLCGFFVY